MTKKDYQAIARALHINLELAKGIPPDTPAVKDERNPTGTPYAPGAWGAIGAIADVLAADNPRFDRQRFIHACESGNMGHAKKKAAG